MTIIATMPLFPEFETEVQLTWENTTKENLCWNLKHQSGMVIEQLEQNIDDALSVNLFNLFLARAGKDPAFLNIITELPLN